MGIRVSRQTAALIAMVLIVAFGLLVFSAPARPKVAAAGPESGIAAACSPGSRTGRADLHDNLQTSDKLTLAVRTPSDYDPTRAYPLLSRLPAGRIQSTPVRGFLRPNDRGDAAWFHRRLQQPHSFVAHGSLATGEGGRDRRELFLCR